MRKPAVVDRHLTEHRKFQSVNGSALEIDMCANYGTTPIFWKSWKSTPKSPAISKRGIKRGLIYLNFIEFIGFLAPAHGMTIRKARRQESEKHLIPNQRDGR
jgi:hypothetical protein